MSRPRTSTTPLALAKARLYDKHRAELERVRKAPRSTTRRCPVCGSSPGDGFATYCSTEHLLRGKR